MGHSLDKLLVYLSANFLNRHEHLSFTYEFKFSVASLAVTQMQIDYGRKSDHMEKNPHGHVDKHANSTYYYIK